nr:ATP-binding protein [uncultured Rhodopila sp.]
MELSKAERRAQEATKRAPFAVNLADVRSTVEEILSQVGRFNFFDEFTPHNIRHVDEMLKMLDWLIPADTQEIMSPADWFLITMSCYFHDLGLLITKEEFANRAHSGFQRFCEQSLFSGEKGEDYRHQLSDLSEIERDKFLYQEFVRANHGRRVRAWIENSQDPSLGTAQPAVKLIDGLLTGLDGLVRRDLATICESHTLNDLGDFKKYPVVRPYGNNQDDTANVHYCAILLRSVDLLQVTSDRAPTTLLKLINPADPISQTHWARQGAVRRIINKPPKPTTNSTDAIVSSDTIKVFVNFSDENGYFGLTSYLSYAERELGDSAKLTRQAADEFGVPHLFPWRHIDTSSVEADNFIKEQYEFHIDQSKILDLLTGHTIYNNSLVVVRELVQNSLDAIRLQNHIFSHQNSENPAQKTPEYKGIVQILWDADAKVLEVLDNGTGMSQATIENHLLKVGSSKYQDNDFKKVYPDFSPISRFGIGVLTAFMVADSVEIMTSEKGDIQVRKISLRSVHGKYLIRLLEKPPLVRSHNFPEHGTSVKLKLRRSITSESLLSALRKWIVIPGCAVEFCEAGESAIQIGHTDAKAALNALLEEQGLRRNPARKEYDVRQKEMEGLQIAYAMRWSEPFHEWELALSRRVYRDDIAPSHPTPCICIQGIAVEFTTPGFRGDTILVIANWRGPLAPRTNVARTSLEDTSESNALSATAYQVFRSAIEEEVQRLRTKEGLTLTKAINEVPFLIAPLNLASARDPDALRGEIAKLEVCIIEGLAKQAGRVPQTVHQLQSSDGFWTVESEAMRSAESLLGQFASDSSIHTAVEQLSNGTVTLPRPLLCNLSSLGSFQKDLYETFEINEVHSFAGQQRLDFFWAKRTNDCCINADSLLNEAAALKDIRLREHLLRTLGAGRSRNSRMGLWIGLPKMKVEGLQEFGYLQVYNRVMVLPSQPVASFIAQLLEADDPGVAISAFVYVDQIMQLHERFTGEPASSAEIARRFQRIEGDTPGLKLVKRSEFLEVLEASATRSYDPLVWRQRAFSSSVDNESW